MTYPVRARAAPGLTAGRPRAARPSLDLGLIERPLARKLRPGGGQRPTLVTDGASSSATGSAALGGSGSFFRACILLLLREQPSHGYDLLERLSAFGFDSGDSGWLYRTLRAFERERVVSSTWEISASGPPRRVYALTASGDELLDTWAISVRASRRAIEGFLGRHARSRPGAPPAGSRDDGRG